MKMKKQIKYYFTLYIILIIGFSILIPPGNALGNTSLTQGSKMVYNINAIRTQNWQINGTWENISASGIIDGWMLLNESRVKRLTGSITVTVLGVRYSVVDLQVSYDLKDRMTETSQQINDSTDSLTYYRAQINYSEHSVSNRIVEDTTETSLANYSDSFEMEVDIRTREILEIYQYNSTEVLSDDFFTFVDGDTVYCSYWIFPDSARGDEYKLSHAGLNHELRGDLQNYLELGNGFGDWLTYEIESGGIYIPPSGIVGAFQQTWIASYESVPSPDTGSREHDFTIDLDKYSNEFIFDADTGVLLQYHRVFKIEPFDIIDEDDPGNENQPIYEFNDMYNLDFNMYLASGSFVNIGLSLLWIIILTVGIIVVAIVLIYMYIKKRRK
ncbi:MAG: hypothetical protein GF329_18925 [Candidatus Lokiarchaeota archaeon]|nr:hypothetical protein [Candidatus Lokiarchaeota archaeon]